MTLRDGFTYYLNEAKKEWEHLYHDWELKCEEIVSLKVALEDAKTPRWSWIPYSTSSAPAANNRYLVKLANDWVCCATYYLDHQQNGNCQWKWKGDNAQEIISVKYWKGLEE